MTGRAVVRCPTVGAWLVGFAFAVGSVLFTPVAAQAQAATELAEDDPADMPDLQIGDDAPEAPINVSQGEGVRPDEAQREPAELDNEVSVVPAEDQTPADAPSIDDETPPLPSHPSAIDSDDVELPGQAQNLVIEERSRRGALWIPRLIFAPLRFAFWLVTAPLVALSRLNDRYHLVSRFFALFVSEDGTYGLVPNAFVETGFGLNFGIRAFHRNLFGKKESILARMGWGGYYNQRYELSVSSGERSSHVTVEAGVRYLKRQNDRFFGVGNAPLEDAYEVDLPLPVYDGEHTVQSRYRRRTLLGELALSFPLADRVRLRIANQWNWSRFARGDLADQTAWIDQSFDNSELVGFFDRQTNATTDVRLIVDRRAQSSTYVPLALPSHGAFLQAWGSWQQGVREDPSQFGRVGADLDGYINLYEHDRVLRIRTRFEAIIGERENVPFDGWALLSGPNLLRGYSRMRFRSRYAGLASVEYRYPVAANLMAFAFTDMGIVFNELSQAHPRDWRFGYGGGIMAFSDKGFLFGLQIAASSEGLYVNFSLAPADATSEVP